MNGLSEGYKRAVDQNWGLMAKIGFFGQKPRFWAKKPLPNGQHVLATTGKSCSKKKVAFFQINISLLRNFGCFFWDKTYFWPIWSNARPKNNVNKLSRWFSVIWVPKLSLTPIKFRIFGQKRTNLAQNGHFWSNIGIIGIFGPMRDQKIMWTKCLSVFSVIWVPKILLSLVILGQAMPAYLVPWWWVGWWLWRAGCISQDTMTPIYFIYVNRGLDYYIPNTQ